jgi:hypothetical protein
MSWTPICGRRRQQMPNGPIRAICDRFVAALAATAGVCVHNQAATG